MKDLSGYDAIVMYSRGLYLDDGQIAEVERVGASGVPVFTNTLRNFTLSLNHNVTNEQQHTLREYLKNGNKHNYRNVLLYLRHIATPHRWDTKITSLPSHCWKTCSTTANTAATSVLRKR